MTIRSIATLVFFVAASLSAGLIGMAFMGDSLQTWYPLLEKPFWNPPNWVFGPVWTTLYVLMGTAAFLVSRSKQLGKTLVLWLFLAHLLVNAFWSIAFFSLQEVLLAFIVILLLIALIATLIRLFSTHSRLAAWLLVPYLLWTLYASTLNLAILVLN